MILIKRKEDKNQYIIDPDTSDYVKMIFLWRSLGDSPGQICTKLDLIDAPFPGSGNNHSRNKAWNNSTVERIISNRVYSGDVCFGKTKNRMSRDEHKVKYVPEDEWTIRVDQHDPLVTSYTTPVSLTKEGIKIIVS